MASLFVLASGFGGCLADCEVAGNEVCEDDRWLMVSCDQTDGGYVCDMSLSVLCVSCWADQHRDFVAGSALSAMGSDANSMLQFPLCSICRGGWWPLIEGPGCDCSAQVWASDDWDCQSVLRPLLTAVLLTWQGAQPAWSVFSNYQPIKWSFEEIILCCLRISQDVGSAVLAFYFTVRIWYVFSISKYRGESDLGRCMTSVLSKRMRLCSADFRRILRPNTLLNRKSALCSRILL